MSSAELSLLKLALSSCERGDAEGARQLLSAVVAEYRPREPPAPTNTATAVTITALARLLGYSPRHVRALIARKRIPASAVIGRGRATRIFVDAARSAHVQRRSALRDRRGREQTDRTRAGEGSP